MNGKKRGEMSVPANMPKDEIEAAALAHERVLASLDGRDPRKVIVVPGRLVNVVG